MIRPLLQGMSDLVPYRYDDYRSYLRDWFWTSKQRNPRLSFRSVSRRLGLKAPNHFHLVITEKRHLSKALFEKALTMIKVGTRERHFLRLLHEISHARTPEATADLRGQIEVLRKASGREDLGSDQYRLVAHTLAWHIRMAARKFQGVTLDQLIKVVKSSSVFAVDDDQIDEAVRLLTGLGLMKVDDKQCCHFDEDDITTRWNFESDAVKAHHAGNLNLALQTVPWPMDRRFFTSVTVPCTPGFRDEIVADLRTLCLKILDASKSRDEDGVPANQLATLQIALFPFFDFSQTSSVQMKVSDDLGRSQDSSQ